MADIPGTTRAQTNFLRACTKDPWGLTPSDWPNAITFRRWMRRATFRKAIKGVRNALRFQADLHLAAASAAAAQALNQSLVSGVDIQKLATQREQIQYLTTLLRLSHVRERFSRDYEAPEPETHLIRASTPERRRLIQYLREKDNHNATVGWMLGELEREEQRAMQSSAAPRAA
jgi:hypothetical protein